MVSATGASAIAGPGLAERQRLGPAEQTPAGICSMLYLMHLLLLPKRRDSARCLELREPCNLFSLSLSVMMPASTSWQHLKNTKEQTNINK